jgi:uncharacterized cofD-like protein
LINGIIGYCRDSVEHGKYTAKLTGDIKTAIIAYWMDNKDQSRFKNLKRRFSSYTYWLVPGVGVKRWFILILIGITLIALGLAVVLLEVYRTAPEGWFIPILSFISLQNFARPVRALVFSGIGLLLILFGMRELNRSILRPLVTPGKAVSDSHRSFRRKGKGPRVVAVGGGHGLATLLRGMKKYTNNITAIVTVADDGGSSGRLRKELGILPPGDIRNCLAALSDDEALLGQLFQYRFPDGDPGLEGHSFGNLFISALAEITGSFEEAVAESGRVLSVYGRVLPSTLRDVKLVADVRLPNISSEVRIAGESQIPETRGTIHHVWLEPNNPPAFPEAIQGILSADLIIVGPGSLYTSILPNLLVSDISEAIRHSKAARFVVCNVATQVGETDSYSCFDHIKAIELHTGKGLFDLCLVNDNFEGELPDKVDFVSDDPVIDRYCSVYRADIVDSLYPWRHDSEKLAEIIINLYQERTGPLVE